MGVLEYERFTEKMATRIRVRVSQYIGEEEHRHLLSVLAMIPMWEPSPQPLMSMRVFV
jgi:hypothetical protein